MIVSRSGKVVLEVPMATKNDDFYRGPSDRSPQRPVIQIFNPTQLPVVARMKQTASHGEELEFLVRLETPTHWYEVLAVDGKVVSGSNLQWFKGGRDAVVSVGWQPMNKPEFDVPNPLSLFMGSVRQPAAGARIVYADVSTEPLELATPTKPTGGGIAGWFIYEMTPARRDRRPLRLEAVDLAGKVLGTSPVPKGA